MKNSILFYFILLTAYISNAQETITIPDIGLEECLIDLKIDSNGLNGTILLSDAEHVINLNINNPLTNKLLPNVHSKIKDLTGLESFPNLKRLDCYDNEITKIDLSKSTSITFLNCNDNKIESLDLSKNTFLNYISCDNNNLNELVLGNNPNLESLYCSYNKLTLLDVSNCLNLVSMDTSGNQIKNIITNPNQLNNLSDDWYKDEKTIYITSDDVVRNPIKITNINSKSINKTVVSKPTSTQNKSSKESTSNYYEKFQHSVVTEYDKLVLARNHLESKKNELQQKYNLDAKQLTQWINKFGNLTDTKNIFKNSDIGPAKKYTASYYTKFKKSAVEEYENAVLNPAYLQSKKVEIQQKYNLDIKEFSNWIKLLGNPSFKAKTVQPLETAKDYYQKFKKSVVKEYESLVLNATHIQKNKNNLQKKYNLTSSQLNVWIKKYSKVLLLH